MRGIIAAIRLYWTNRSIYAPFVCLIFFLLFVWFSGVPYVTFGPNAETDRQITVYGHFLPHPSISIPYRFIDREGKVITLNCRPRMKKSYCVYWDGEQNNIVSLSYAPYIKNYINNIDGLITVIRFHSRVIFINRIVKDSRDNQETALMMKYWTERPFLFFAAFAPISVFIFILFGVMMSIRRIFFKAI